MSTAKLLCQLQASVCCWPLPVTWLLDQLLPSGLGSASGALGVLEGRREMCLLAAPVCAAVATRLLSHGSCSSPHFFWQPQNQP